MDTIYPFKLSNAKKKLLETTGHILALGGPGSGKTTIALFKAKKIITDGLKRGQRVLFLSFARATISRVDQQAKSIITKDVYKQLEINTYHGFTWGILKAHGYLLNDEGKPLKLLPPPEAASRLAGIKSDLREKEKNKLFTSERLVHFDLFAKLCFELLSQSSSLCTILSDVYPVIILDEFQDTNSDEWKLIQLLAKKSTIIALADLDQRIYEFRGADPARISDYIKFFTPKEFDFGIENNRSNGTDIVQFGNDLLTEENKHKKYNNVEVKNYTYKKGDGIHVTLKTEVLRAITRQVGTTWSIALLVPSKKLMISVSDYLASKQQFPNNRNLPAINHDVALEMSGPSLSAILIARLMETSDSDQECQHLLLESLYEHIRGRNGNDPVSQQNLKLADALKAFISSGKVSGKNRELAVNEALRIASACRCLNFTGDPVTDWISIRKILSESSCEAIQQAAIDAQYLRLLRKGAAVSSGLNNLWRTTGSYKGATNVIRSALTQEHFSASPMVWKGLHVMTMHKAKGKEFDEVIIYEGLYTGRIIKTSGDEKAYHQSKLALRVAVTRAMKRATIITPANDPCRFLF